MVTDDWRVRTLMGQEMTQRTILRRLMYTARAIGLFCVRPQNEKLLRYRLHGWGKVLLRKGDGVVRVSIQIGADD